MGNGEPWGWSYGQLQHKEISMLLALIPHKNSPKKHQENIIFLSFSDRCAVRKKFYLYYFPCKTFIFSKFGDGTNFATKTEISCISFLVRMTKKKEKTQFFSHYSIPYSGTDHMRAGVRMGGRTRTCVRRMGVCARSWAYMRARAFPHVYNRIQNLFSTINLTRPKWKWKYETFHCFLFSELTIN